MADTSSPSIARSARGIEFEQVVAAKPQTRQPWPPALADRFRLIRGNLHQQPAPLQPEDLAGNFVRARTQDIREILQTFVSLGHAREVNGRYVS